MNIEFHYYINLIIAAYSGYGINDAYTIAYSAQYVDNNTKFWYVYRKKEEPSQSGLMPNSIPTKESYQKFLPTQTSDLSLSFYTKAKIYLPFHFIPGNFFRGSRLRLDNRIHQLCTTPNSFLARYGLEKALVSGQMHRIGIASHAFVDTWAHQNFVGIHDSFNVATKLCAAFTKCLEKDYMPVGHMDALHDPDLIGEVWHDSRLKQSQIANNERFMQAAKSLCREYCRYLWSGVRNSTTQDQKDKIQDQSWCSQFVTRWERLKPILTKIFQTFHIDDRMNIYNDTIKKLSKCDMVEYNQRLWLDAATYSFKPESKISGSGLLSLSVQTLMWRDRYYKHSDWYKFQSAAGGHVKCLWPLINKKLKLVLKSRSC